MKKVNVIMGRLGLFVLATMMMPQTSFGQRTATAQELNAEPHKHGENVQAERGTLCRPHGSPAEKCFICDPDLREKGRLWCREHDRYEDRCFLCHPDMKDAGRAWCEEHFLYEDECIFCRTISPEGPDGAPDNKRDSKRLWCREHDIYEDECILCHPELEGKASTGKPNVLICVEHDVPEHECGICHPELIGELSSGDGMKIRFASDEAAAKAAVKTAVARVGKISGGVEVYAELMFNQNKLAHVALPVDGIIRSVDVDLGDKVKRGDVLATVTSVEISRAIGGYMRALAEDRLSEQSVARERKLREEQISSEKDLQQAIAARATADAEVLQTRQQLATLGLSALQMAALEEEEPNTALLEVRAPFDGEIVARTAVLGALVETGVPLFKVADRSTMWAMLNISANDIDRVRAGQQVEVTLDSAPDQIFVGKITWVAAEVDERTRMAKARAEVANPGNRLRSGTFARGRIITSSSNAVVIIPQSSLQQLDDKPLAFVKLAEDLYEARPVKLGVKQDGHYEVLSGLSAGETIVVGNSFVMKSQLLLSRLGAGCVDD